jgi:ankyrin repeat protein
MPDHELTKAFPTPPPSQQEVDEFRHAASRGDKGAVTAFLDRHPAAVNSLSAFGDTALVCAAQLGRKEIVELLLAKGAIADAPDSGGWTPFMWATLYGHQDAAEMLWEKTVSRAAKDHRKATEAALKLKKSSLTDIKNLVDASAKGDINTVAAYLERDITIINQVSGGHSALNMAAFKGHKDIVELLLEKGALLEMRNSGGSTPLMCAAGEGHTDIVELLWKKGASLNVRNNKGHTPLMWAALSGKTETVRFFLEQGVPLDDVDAHGQTALALARLNGRTRTIELLEQWPEIRLQLAKKQAEELAQRQAEAEAGTLNALRLEKLKGLRPPTPPFKKGQP